MTNRHQCGARGPFGSTCTDYPGHSYAHYDMGEDRSWTDHVEDHVDGCDCGACQETPTTGATAGTAECVICHRKRDESDADDYAPMQVITGHPCGWYSGDDGEICGPCMTKIIGGQR